jgi:hypothetical protein
MFSLLWDAKKEASKFEETEMFLASCKPLTRSTESGYLIQRYGSPDQYQNVTDLRHFFLARYITAEALERITANAKSTTG